MRKASPPLRLHARPCRIAPPAASQRGAKLATVSPGCRVVASGHKRFRYPFLKLGLDGCGRSSSPAQAASRFQSMPVTRAAKAALEIPEVVADSLELAARVRVLSPGSCPGEAGLPAGLSFQHSPWLPVGEACRLPLVSRDRKVTADWLARSPFTVLRFPFSVIAGGWKADNVERPLVSHNWTGR